MKCSFSFMLISVINFLNHANAEIEEDNRRYRIVSEYDFARSFYPQIRSTKPYQNEPKLLWFHRRKICEDVVNSNFIGSRMGYYVNYDGKGEDNPIKSVAVSPNYYKSEETIEEWGFVCPVQKKGRLKSTEIFISEAYKLSGNSPTTDVVGRFLFLRIKNSVNLQGLAEPVANAFSHDQYEIEELYLRRRKNYDTGKASNFRSGRLCSLEFQEKIRICAAVFTSEYFEKLRFSYPIFQINWVNGSCMKEVISFRTTNGKAEASKKKYEEYLMSCRPAADEEKSVEFMYHLSHAYKSNQIFVFKSVYENKARKLYLDNLSTNVRF